MSSDATVTKCALNHIKTHQYVTSTHSVALLWLAACYSAVIADKYGSHTRRGKHCQLLKPAWSNGEKFRVGERGRACLSSRLTVCRRKSSPTQSAMGWDPTQRTCPDIGVCVVSVAVKQLLLLHFSQKISSQTRMQTNGLNILNVIDYILLKQIQTNITIIYNFSKKKLNKDTF